MLTIARMWADSEKPRFYVAVVQDISQRKQVEVALLESEQRFREAMASLPVPVMMASADGPVLSANAAFVSRFGYSAEELPTVEVAASKILPDAALRERILTQWREDVDGLALSSHTTRVPIRTYPFTCADGTVRTVEAALRPLSGNLVVGIFNDVTEREQAAAALRRMEEQQRVALDAVEQGTWRHDIASGVMTFDLRACQHFGLQKSVVTVDEFLDCIHPDDRGRVRQGVSQVTAPSSSGRASDELRVLLPSGDIHWVSVTVRVVFAGEGADRHALHTIVTSRDITRTRQAEEALRASEERYRSLVNNLDDIVFSTDAQGRVTFVNPAIRAFGWRQEDIIGRSSGEFLAPAVAPNAPAVEVAQGPMETQILDASGKTRFIRTSANPIIKDGVFSGLSGVVVDLTRQRETEEQLRAAQKMEAIGRLAGGVAHDFNNILSVILSYAELAGRSLEPGAPAAEDLAEVVTAGKRAAVLTRVARVQPPSGAGASQDRPSGAGLRDRADAAPAHR